MDTAMPAHGAHDTAALMAANGIQCVPVDYFHWNSYRYTSLKDALAAAERARSGRGHVNA